MNYLYFLGIFLLVYILIILRNLFRIGSINRLINSMHEIMDSLQPIIRKYKASYFDEINSFSDYMEASGKIDEIYKLPKFLPKMKRFLPGELFFYLNIGYNEQPLDIYQDSVKVLNHLVELRDQYIDDIQSTLNPLYALKTIFRFPSSLLGFLGIRFSSISSKNLISFIIWLFGFIISFFTDEIKEFIVQILS